MPASRTSLLTAMTLTLTVVAGCSADDEPLSSGTPTVPDSVGAEPTEVVDPDASEEPTDDSSDEPTPALPTDLPTGMPTDLGECEDLYASAEEAAGALDDVVADPSLAQETFADVSAALREASADNSEEVAAAAEELATLYDEMGAIISSGDVTALANLDVDRLTAASTALQEACQG